MSTTLEVAILFLILALIVVLVFAAILLFDSIKLVKNLDEATTIIKEELEPTLQELTKTLSNLNGLTQNADKQIGNLRKLLSGVVGISSVTLSGVKSITGGLLKGIIAGFKLINKSKKTQ